jgi:hypothetical protein
LERCRCWERENWKGVEKAILPLQGFVDLLGIHHRVPALEGFGRGKASEKGAVEGEDIIPRRV